MSEAVWTSAFLREPMPVEVAHRGSWLSGDLLGWQHDATGQCLARVRCVIDGLRYTAWIGLADVRLPEPAETPAAPGAPEVPLSWHRAVGEHTLPRLVRAERGLVGGPPTVPPRPRTPDGGERVPIR